MTPHWLKIKIPRPDGEPLNLYFPMLIIWILLTLIMLIFLPFILLFYLFFWFKWYGKLAIMLFPMLFSLIWQLKGLQIDIKDRNGKIYFSFI
jgi:hypothetical protein